MSTPTIPNPLMGSRAKVERAKEHIKNLDLAIKAFFNSNPYTINIRRNLKTGKHVFYAADVEDVPIHIAAIAGDVVHSLRSALDYIAYQLVYIGTAGQGLLWRAEFPIFDSADEYAAKKQGKIEGMRPEAIEAIDIIKPYKDGNTQLWLVHKLNIIDKHRLLIAVSSYLKGFNLAPMFEADMKRILPDVGKISFPTNIVRPKEVLCPLKTGDELLVVDGFDTESYKRIQSHIVISFYEPQIMQCEPILTTLQQLIEATTAVIESFASNTFWSP